MTFPSIRIEGANFSGDLLAKVVRDDFPGQKPADFGLPGGTQVKDEIARAWAEAQSPRRRGRCRGRNWVEATARVAQWFPAALPTSLVLALKIHLGR